MLKPGYKTTEFALALLVDVGALAAALAKALSPHWAAIAAMVSSSAYALARGLAKLSPPPVVVPPAPDRAVTSAAPVQQA